MEIQGRGNTSAHHLPHGGEGLLVSIKNKADTGSEISKIEESKYLDLVTYLYTKNFIYALYIVHYPRARGYGPYGTLQLHYVTKVCKKESKG